MSRKPIKKELINTRLLKDYASWVYCTECNNTIAYLCYVTYDEFDFEYTCKCKNVGYVHIEFEHSGDVKQSCAPLVEVKNRLCCPEDHSPLVTVVDKNLQKYRLSVLCNKCSIRYRMNG